MKRERLPPRQRFAADAAEALCTCGHPKRRHIEGRGACFDDGWQSVLCPRLCRRFAYDVDANAALIADGEEVERQLAKIRATARYIDAGPIGDGWRPSELLTIGYCVLSTSQRPESAAPWLDDVIAEARDRYRRGLYANPFTNDPAFRPAGAP